jgi:cell division protein FtsL
MKIRPFKVNRKYLLISIWALLILLVAHYSYPYVREYRLKKEIGDLEKKIKENSSQIDSLESRLDSLQNADEMLLNKILHGDYVPTKK